MKLDRSEQTPGADSSPKAVSPLGAEDINTVVGILVSGTIIKRVADRLTGDDLRQFMEPYETGEGHDPGIPVEILAENRRATAQKQGLLLFVQYRHPDRQMAAKVSTLFAEELIAYFAQARAEDYLRSVQEAQIRADQQTRKINDLSKVLHENETKMAAAPSTASPQDRETEEANRQSLQHELEIEQEVLKQITARVIELKYRATLSGSPVLLILDPAFPPAEEDYVSPNFLSAIGLGLVGALGCGVAAVIGVGVARLFFWRIKFV